MWEAAEPGSSVSRRCNHFTQEHLWLWRIHRSGFCFHTHSAGVASMEVFAMATLLALPIWIRVRRYKGHKNPPSPTNLGILRAVKHTDLYSSYTDKCIIDANCCDSLVFGSPFIFPTRWLMHTGSAPGIVLILKHSAGKQQCTFPLQIHITHNSISLSIKGWGKLPLINHMRHDHPSCVSALCKTMFKRIWRQNIAFHWPHCCKRCSSEAVMPQAVECLHILHADAGFW